MKSPLWAPAARDLSLLNTLGLTSVARQCIAFTDDTFAEELAAFLHDWPGMPLVLGGGSNVVLPPQLERLVVLVQTRGRRLLETSTQARVVEAAAGENWHEFVQWCLEQGWPGLENLALIPGTVGAAPVQNIGAYGVELAQRLHSVQALNLQSGRLVDFTPEDCRFAYRDSVFKQAGQGVWLITRVRFRLPVCWQPVVSYPDLQRRLAGKISDITPRDVFETVCTVRREKLPDPKVLGNAGSFFKNPLVSAERHRSLLTQWPDMVAYEQADGQWKLAAGWLIDRAGWKGRRQGPVGVHERQALVLVNHGGAAANDVEALAAQIREDICRRFGVELEQEPVRVEP